MDEHYVGSINWSLLMNDTDVYKRQDYNIRTFLKKKLYAAGVSKLEIARDSDRVKVCLLYTSRCV